MNIYRGSFRRLLELDAQIRAGKLPNCTSFAREWEISTKTVQRDLEFLRDRLGAPLEYDHAGRGYRYTEAAWRLPRLELTEGELFELAVLSRLAAQYEGTPLEGSLLSVLDKIRASLEGPLSIDPVAVQSGFSSHGHPVRSVAPETWTTVAHAVRDRRLLRARYRKLGARRARVHDVEPVHLACIDGEWSLVCTIRPYTNRVILALSRIEELEETQTLLPSVEFDVAAYFANRFVRFVGMDDRAHEVVIRFSSSAAPEVRERTWHRAQRLRRLRDGAVELRFPAPSLVEVERWVLRWGAAAEVLGPPELRASVAAHASRMADTYGVSGRGGRRRTRGAGDA